MPALAESGVQPGSAARPAGAGWPVARPGRAPPPLRLVLALVFGAAGLLTTFALAAVVGREATARLEAEVGGQLAEVAGQMARSLDQGMFERWRDIQIAAASETLGDPGATPAARRAVMARLAATYPAYSILGLVDADGRIAVTSSGLLEGADVSGRDYFRGARERPFVGDVHAAYLLQRHLAPEAREPLRLLDVAAPVTAADGRFLGVLVAHLDWTWARDMARTLSGGLRGSRAGAEILILARDGTVLLGPPALQGQVLPDSVLADGRPLDPEGTSRLGPWPDDACTHLAARARTQGHRDYPGLGWQVVVRQTSERALASVAALRARILAAGSAVALGAALLAWLLAGRIARPLGELAVAAGALGRGAGLPPLPRSLVREGETIAAALTGAAAELARREETHRLLIDELNHRVKNTLATVQSLASQSLKGPDAGAGREAFEARLLALSRAHDVLTRESWASADLRGIAGEAVRPFVGGEAGRFTLEGPDLRLPPEAALALTLILHELCTNAVKYGALSVPGGRAALAWTVEAGPTAPPHPRGAAPRSAEGASAPAEGAAAKGAPADGAPERTAPSAASRTLRLTWRERGGPPVQAPARRGFGTRLLRRGLGGGEAASLAYGPEGFAYATATTLPGTAATPSRPPQRG